MASPARLTLAELREAAARHQLELEEPQFATVAQLARRWQVSQTTVRDVPFDELPFKEFGRGLKLRRRRYRWADVHAYEARR